MKDPTLIWNEVALEANRVSHTDTEKREQNGPPLSARALAIVHLAMYDAHAAVKRNPWNLPPYLPGLPPAPAGATTRAAVAAAAHTVLAALYTRQTAAFDAALAAHGDPGNPGHAFGVAVANALLADRAGDPSTSDAGYVPSMDRFRHRPDPDHPGQGFHAPFYGAKCKGFAITARHGLEPPPRGDDDYLRALRQVRAKGIAPELMGILPKGPREDQRTPVETLIGVYWGYDGTIGLGTPPRLYNQIVCKVALARGNTEDQNARLFALVNAAMSDAGMLSWDQKYLHDLWRPVVAVREHDPSCGPAGPETGNDLPEDADPFWQPLGAPKSNILNKRFFPGAPPEPPTNRPAASLEHEVSALAVAEDPRLKCEGCLTLNKNFTPNFPAYPSAHAAFGAAAFHVTRLFYGVKIGDRKADDLFNGLDFISGELNGETQDNRGMVRPRHRREFEGGLWQMIIENSLSRIYLGIHWSFDSFKVRPNGSLNLGRNIGGVPLGLKVAEDIYASGMKKSAVGPRA